MLLLARWILPVSAPPIENGAVVVEGNHIAFVGPRADLPPSEDEIRDLGNSVLLPGLVNAHCHLEFSALRDRIAPRQGHVAWAKDVVREQFLLPLSEKEAAVGVGLRELLAGGTTTVVDHCHPENPELLLSKDIPPLRRLMFWEVLGASFERAQESLLHARGRSRGAAEGDRGFITPHSLYAVDPEILEEIFLENSSLTSLHVLESDDEERFFRRQDGPLAHYVRERGGDLSFPLPSPVLWLEANQWLGPKTLLVHGNYLNDQEIEALKRSGAGVIHCPGSHRFFGHRRFPLEILRQKGVPIALGTDGLSSNESLSLFREMGLLKEQYPALEPSEILTMATRDGARLLGMDKEIGAIDRGKKADLVAVPATDRDPYETVILAKKASFAMIDGQEIHV